MITWSGVVGTDGSVDARPSEGRDGRKLLRRKRVKSSQVKRKGGELTMHSKSRRSTGCDCRSAVDMGRWSSDIHRLYVRACFDDVCEWTRRAGSRDFAASSGHYDEVDEY